MEAHYCIIPMHLGFFAVFGIWVLGFWSREDALNIVSAELALLAIQLTCKSFFSNFEIFPIALLPYIQNRAKVLVFVPSIQDYCQI